MGIDNKLNAAETSGEITSSLQNRWWLIMYQYLEKVSVFIDQLVAGKVWCYLPQIPDDKEGNGETSLH